MLHIIKHGIVLEKTMLDFENEGVLNPGVILFEDKIHMFYRAVHTGNHSSIGYCIFESPLKISFRSQTPVLKPEYEYESKGMEDPRVVNIEGTFYMTYAAYNGTNALGALAISGDLKTWKRHGIMVPQVHYPEFKKLTEKSGAVNDKYWRFNHEQGNQEFNGQKKFVWDKNVIFFPERINGMLAFLHRIKPDIQSVLYIKELEELTPDFWNHYLENFSSHIVMGPKYDHEISYIGGGCPPIKTEAGWLLIYHGVQDSISGYVYSACAALLDLNNPNKEIARLPYPLFSPEYPWEVKGEVNNVCFPTGAVVINQELFMYYGAADERIACASVDLKALIQELTLNLHEHVE